MGVPDGTPAAGGGTTRSAPPSGGSVRDTTWLPNTSDWYGRFNLDQNLANDFLIDREAQRTWKSFTGIKGIRQQDMAVTETMGTIYNRSREHLGTTDQFIIRVRRKLIATAKALREHGTVPIGVDNPAAYRQRSGEMILPRAQDWWQAYEERREQFNANALSLPTPLTTT